jgi:hydroxyacylglutathione hydrolase
MVDVVPIPCLSDNYAYLVGRPGSREVIVVDPSEAAPVERALAERGLELVGILNTHHHWDHVGGNEELLAKRPDLPVYAHASDRGRVPRQTVEVHEGEPFEVAGMRFSSLHVPGHTLGAVTYVTDGAAFTGDTLFIGGCGRLFEGTPQMMFDSFKKKLAALPADTRLYVGHEYTVKNLEFAAHAEPSNADVARRLDWAKKERAAGHATVPSSVADELATNPFMRARDVDHFAELRRAKDTF